MGSLPGTSFSETGIPSLCVCVWGGVPNFNSFELSWSCVAVVLMPVILPHYIRSLSTGTGNVDPWPHLISPACLCVTVLMGKFQPGGSGTTLLWCQLLPSTGRWTGPIYLSTGWSVSSAINSLKLFFSISSLTLFVPWVPSLLHQSVVTSFNYSSGPGIWANA